MSWVRVPSPAPHKARYSNENRPSAFGRFSHVRVFGHILVTRALVGSGEGERGGGLHVIAVHVRDCVRVDTEGDRRVRVAETAGDDGDGPAFLQEMSRVR